MEGQENQEQMMQLQILGQEAQELEKQLQMIDQHISDLTQLTGGLNELENSKEKEIYANIGKGIFVPAEIKGKELIVEVGNKNLVRKTIPETKQVIDSEMNKLVSAKSEIMSRVGMLQTEMQKVMSSEECGCKKNEECGCKDNECNCE